MITWLKGKKTFIGIVAGIIYSVAIYYKLVPSNELVWTAILGWTGIAFRLGIKNS